MRVRRNPLPRRLVDILCYLVIGVFLPIVFIFEIIVVLPAIHEPGGFLHTFTFLMAMFLLFNIKGNLIVSMLIDTSVDEQCRPPPEGDAARLEWRHCAICDRLAPPRSWHCKLCGVCILRRDHHCNIVGSCVGHHTMRYFVCFVAQFAFGSIYSTIYQLYFMLGYNYTLLVTQLVCGPFPLFELVTINVFSWKLLAVYTTCSAFCYYLPHVLHGTVRFDSGPKYDCGLAYNLRCVLGERMFLVLLSPFIVSELPTDGYSFQINPNHITAKSVMAV
ncbi:probable palmitoyltransferase ZDHHC24 isoform X3 [Drosophila navojoa]|uniref:probable palmitoyltransferase ZDHHC24 isoform X3 n=1 Tax=Drosophila navojoa TaxID=7232 RepID=UPI0011BFBD8D|nr:probable palmitoyltransferase ZDHHC24 isoform X3 [Drosophila navojoa]